MQNLRALWLAVSVLSAGLVGASGGILSWLGGANPANAILTGAGAFVATVLLFLAIVRFLTMR
jgi:hypothetical protein